MTVAPEKVTREAFDITAQVVFQLGKQLITDEFQALLELIKNSYDADAKKCQVTVRLEDAPPEASVYTDAKGYIQVADSGHGMSHEDVSNNWLVISHSMKRDMKKHGTKTALGRLPTGDKGLGRLGVQRLGANVELWSRKEGYDSVKVEYSWNEFTAGSKLSTVRAKITENPDWPDHIDDDINTILLISQIEVKEADRDDWRNRFLRETATMTSPFESIDQFRVTLDLDEVEIDPTSVAQSFIKHAGTQYDFFYENGQLSITGKFKLPFFRPTDDRQLRYYNDRVRADDGKAFRKKLIEDVGVRAGLKPGTEAWYLESTKTWSVANDRNLPDPGRFSGRIYSFNLTDIHEVKSSYYSSKATVKDILKLLAGVRAYRNGFEIKVGRDWLNLSSQFTSGSSFYGLRPDNVLGQVLFTGEDNAKLEEVTDRQGFVVNGAYLRLQEVLAEFVRQSSYVQGLLRRFFVAQFKDAAADLADLSPKDTPASITSSLRANLKTRQATKRDEPWTNENYDRLDAKLAVLEDKLDTNHERMTRFVALAGLGVTAEALTHELENAIKRLKSRTAAMRKKHLKDGLTHQEVLKLMDEVELSAAALEKQLAFLSPTLSHVRERQQRFTLESFLVDYLDFWSERSEAKKITFRPLHVANGGSVKMSKGRLLHILDNLVLNAVYWSQQGNGKPWIELGIEGCRVTVKDSGPGVKESTGDAVFDEFYSERGGRGMGLYIAKELASDIDASIDLGPLERRHFRGFIVNLESKEVHDADN